jgi:predicted lipid-binding transport protein (Tim44 family)
MTFDLILLAIIVIFLFLRLKNQFGKVDESDEERKKIIETFKKQQQGKGGGFGGSGMKSGLKMPNIEQFRREKVEESKKEEIKEAKVVKEEKKSPLGKTLDKIFEKCGNANEKAFLYGSETAFEMVVSSLSNKDFDTLRVLLSKNIFEEFKKEIEKMDKKDQRMSATVVSIPKKEIKSAKIVGKFAYIDVFFESEQIIFIEDNNGKVISGSKDDIKTISEIWTFKKDVNDENPNWLITGTKVK